MMDAVDLDTLIAELRKPIRQEGQEKINHTMRRANVDRLNAAKALEALRRAPLSADMGNPISDHIAGGGKMIAPVSAGKVKALVWHDCPDGTSHDDDCQYEVEQQGKHWRVIRAVTGGTSYLVMCNSREAAKSAAQADYVARIMAAFEPGDGWRDAIRQLLAADRAFMEVEPLTDAQHELSRHVATAAAYGSAAFMAGMDEDQGAHAMMRAILMALIDPLDPALDYLRADPAAGAKTRADRAASVELTNGEGGA